MAFFSLQWTWNARIARFGFTQWGKWHEISRRLLLTKICRPKRHIQRYVTTPITKEVPSLDYFFLSWQCVKNNPNFKIMRSYWLKFEFWLIFTHWYGKKDDFFKNTITMISNWEFYSDIVWIDQTSPTKPLKLLKDSKASVVEKGSKIHPINILMDW